MINLAVSQPILMGPDAIKKLFRKKKLFYFAEQSSSSTGLPRLPSLSLLYHPSDVSNITTDKYLIQPFCTTPKLPLEVNDLNTSFTYTINLKRECQTVAKNFISLHHISLQRDESQ